VIRNEEAEAACRKGIELASDKGEAWLFFSNMMILLKNHEEAVAACRKAISLDPKEPHIWYSLSHLMAFDLRMYKEAEAAYRKAIELNQNDVELTELWEQFAILLGFHLKRGEEAEAACRKAIEISPNKSGSWGGLGAALIHLKRYDEAEAAWRKAIELDPGNGWRWHNLALMLQRRLKRYDDAEAAWRKAIELSPTEPWHWIGYGSLLTEPLKKYEEAEAAYRKAVELAPGNLDFSFALARILVKRGRWDDAVVYARKFIIEGDDEYYERTWPDIIGFFHDLVASGYADAAVALLDETEYGERWRPLREALQAIAEDDSSYLLRVAPEIRRPAEELVGMLAPEGVRLGGAPKAARGRRTRRKKQAD
jgi:tetratricopeptide (TPR) repeat protein